MRHTWGDHGRSRAFPYMQRRDHRVGVSPYLTGNFAMSVIRLDPQFQLDPTQRLRSPGEVLRDDYMLPRAMTAAELARCTGLPLRQVRRVIDGEPIDIECAIRFAVIFQTTALYWMVLQLEFDMARERRNRQRGGLGVL